jgi:hypothetical protein
MATAAIGSSKPASTAAAGPTICPQRSRRSTAQAASQSMSRGPRGGKSLCSGAIQFLAMERPGDRAAEQVKRATRLVMRPCPLRSWFAPLSKPALAQRARA